MWWPRHDDIITTDATNTTNTIWKIIFILSILKAKGWWRSACSTRWYYRYMMIIEESQSRIDCRLVFSFRHQWRIWRWQPRRKWDVVVLSMMEVAMLNVHNHQHECIIWIFIYWSRKGNDHNHDIANFYTLWWLSKLSMTKSLNVSLISLILDLQPSHQQSYPVHRWSFNINIHFFGAMWWRNSLKWKLLVLWPMQTMGPQDVSVAFPWSYLLLTYIKVKIPWTKKQLDHGVCYCISKVKLLRVEEWLCSAYQYLRLTKFQIRFIALNALKKIQPKPNGWIEDLIKSILQEQSIEVMWVRMLSDGRKMQTTWRDIN